MAQYKEHNINDYKQNINPELISKNELIDTLKSYPNNKSPGIDKITKERIVSNF